MDKVELLAPAGDLVALKAAVENGADAVYIGGKAFSARSHAHNFDDHDLASGIKYAHERQVKVYAAMNTLIHNDELGEFLAYAYTLAAAGIDGLIVQDLGAAYLLHQALPELRLHGSTQMTVHNSAGVRYLQKLGFKRVVLARETSLEDVRAIVRESDIEIETFVHGALCVAYSGQCLLSSMIGGRSGNRGQCAQPCRLKYTLVDRQTGRALTQPEEGAHLLSTRDLMLLHDLPKLVEAGITSLKIEGRMKRPEYVATIVRHYRAALDACFGVGTLDKRADKEISQIFNRDFTTGYFFGKPGSDLMSYARPDNRGIVLGKIERTSGRTATVQLDEPLCVGDGYLILTDSGKEIAGQVTELYSQGKKVDAAAKGDRVELKLREPITPAQAIYKTSDTKLLQKAAASYSTPSAPMKQNLFLHLSARLGQPLVLTGWLEGRSPVEATSAYIVETAMKHASSWEDVRKQLDRLGNTPFRLERLEGELDDGVMVPASELNQLRREIVEQLEQMGAPVLPEEEAYWEALGEQLDRIPPQVKGYAKARLSVMVSHLAGLQAAVDNGAQRVIINMTALRGQEGLARADLAKAVQYCHAKQVELYVTTSAIANEGQLEQVRAIYREALQAGVDGVMVANVGTYQLAQEMGWTTIAADYPLNICNDAVIWCLSADAISQVTLSPELNLQQIAEFAYIGNMPIEVLVHGNFPLMISEQCVLGSVSGGCGQDKACSAPCRETKAGLKDRLGMTFPLYSDENCRMMVYNCKTLDLYKRLADILNTGIDMIRIEARERSAQWIAEVTMIYRQALDSYQTTGKYMTDDEAIEKLAALSPEGSTYGHYFRGVQ